MGKKSALIVLVLLLCDFILCVHLLIRNATFPMLSPAGIIAEKQKALFLTVGSLGLVIILSVIAAAFFIVFKYRETNEKALFTPEATGTKSQMLFWWVIPTLIVFLMGIITWESTHALDPFKPLISDRKPMTIQVVALRWKWLFIYPEQNIATVNYLVIPEKTPITFELTADAPMNSFWIPRLGGQMYAMEGMVTRTHLMADKTGEFEGSTAEISGVGFAGMRFITKSVTSDEFTYWVGKTKTSSLMLDTLTYTQLAKPSEDAKPVFYSAVEQNLYNGIVMKYMPKTSNGKEEMEHDMEQMHH